jgi:hypothetical protein
MGYPAVLDEILRARGEIRPDVFRRWQQQIRADVLPHFDDPPIVEKPVTRKTRAEVPA